MKYPIETIIMINDCEWKVAEYRLGRGREWVYTLSNEDIDGTFNTMRLNETAIGKIMKKEPQNIELISEKPDGIFV